MHRSHPHTLCLASLSLPSAKQLAAAATASRWNVQVLDECSHPKASGPRTFYGGTDKAARYAAQFELALIEPPLDLLARLPYQLLWRNIHFKPLKDLAGMTGPLFIKPADPIHKIFDPGTYHDLEQIVRQGNTPVPADTPVLAAQPVEWTAEFRCFIRDGRITAWSPYLSYGRPIWKPGMNLPVLPNLTAFRDRLYDLVAHLLPPAFVVDNGVLEDGRWAIVEFNPAWCSGLLGTHVAGALQTIERAAMWNEDLSRGDAAWIR